jgi:hypothetical protein
MPLFESLFVFKNIVTGSLIKGPQEGLEVTNARAEHKTSLPLHVTGEPGERFVFRIVYETARFTELRIEQILRHLEMLMAGMVSNPRQPLSQLSLTTEAEQIFDDLATLEDE